MILLDLNEIRQNYEQKKQINMSEGPWTINKTNIRVEASFSTGDSVHIYISSTNLALKD